MGHDVEAYDDMVNVCCPIADASHSLHICCTEGSNVGQVCPEDTETVVNHIMV